MIWNTFETTVKTMSDKEERPTCSSFLQTPFAVNAASAEILDLNPFDAAAIHARDANLTTQCLAFPKTLTQSQDKITVVPCKDCPYGYTGTMSSLACRPAPTCKDGAESCRRCQLEPQTPSIVVPCETCISKQCGMNGQCQCVW